MSVSIIVAMSKNRVIGDKGKIPWMGQLPTDLKRFKELTWGGCVIMGRKTHESIGKPLPNRTNIVITRQIDFRAPGCHLARDLASARKVARFEFHEDVWVIGGGEVFRAAILIADKIHLTIVDAEFEGDVFFPELNPASWREVSRTLFPANDRDKYPHDYVIFERLRR